MNNPKLWIFGDSFSYPYNIEESTSWPVLLSKKLKAELVNFAQPAADNFFIFNSFYENYNKISKEDFVVIGWSHPNRKSFIYDKSNKLHKNAFKDSITLKGCSSDLFRGFPSKTKPKTFEKYSSMSPVTSGNSFFDFWFENYFSRHTQDVELFAFVNAVENLAKCNLINFFFSQESTNNLELNIKLDIISFIKSNSNYFLSNKDFHLSELGHEKWSKLIYKAIRND